MQNWIDIYFTSRDGLRLYARHYGVPGSIRRPLVCLAGLTRNSRDFHDLASALARPDENGRDVFALDCRGRGRSQHDPNWKNYSILVELNDVLDFMTMKGLDRAGIIGTSRGGLIALLMAVLRPNAMGAVVLNGAVIATATESTTNPGQYSATIPAGKLAVGTNSITAVVMDANGTSAATSPPFVVPVNVATPPPPPPAAPVFKSFTPDTNGVDTTSTINLQGTAEASSKVTVFDGSTNLGTTTVDTSGNWTFT